MRGVEYAGGAALLGLGVLAGTGYSAARLVGFVARRASRACDRPRLACDHDCQRRPSVGAIP